MVRRAFLGFGLMLLGFGRRAWAQLASASPGYYPLTHPVRIALDTVSTQWHLVPFVAEAVLPQASPTPGRRVLMNGVLYRRESGNGSSALSALCVTCPHELCQVDLVTDETRLARLATMSGSNEKNPKFVCGCHGSVFDALDDGAWISGPADRGLFNFRVGGITDGTVEIVEVEVETLSVV
jgi:nitrite reductase/ring-hydroxylating ferredoxin subunit